MLPLYTQIIMMHHSATQVPLFCALLQILPDMTSIVSKWQLLSKKEKTSSEEKKAKTEESAEQTDNKNEVPGNNICSTFILSGLVFL